jgi:hypothetical protein
MERRGTLMCLLVLHHHRPCNNACQQKYKILNLNKKLELKTKWTKHI